MIYLPYYLSEDGSGLGFYLVLEGLYEEDIFGSGSLNVLLTPALQAKALISAKCEIVEQNKTMCFTL